MSNPQPICITIKYYGDKKFVELPLDYKVFLNCISSMLGIQKELLGNFQFSYQNNSDLKIYFIKDADDYALFLKICSEQKTKMLDVNFIADMESDNINNNNDNDNNIEIKENNANENYKESIIEEDEKEIKEEKNIQEENNIKNKNSENIINNIDDDLQSLEFSYFNENKNNNMNKKIIINNNKINKNINNNLNNNIIQNNFSGLNAKFEIFCNICKKQKTSDIIYYCNDCKIFFCDICEVDIGKIHMHCYYKIKNQKQYDEINNKLNGNKFEQINNNINRSIINGGVSVENSVKEIFGNIGKSIKNFFNPDENANNNQINNNNQNELNNPYALKNDNNQSNNIGNIYDPNNLKKLVNQAKTLYNLSEFTDKDIEDALLQNNGNLENAVSMLLEYKN